MVPLTKEEKEIKEWAGRAFRAPWFEIVEKCAKIKRGEKLPENEIMFHPFFIDVLIDIRLLCRIMELMKISKFVSGNLFTIILSKKEERVIWACVEKEEDGIFTEVSVLNPREKWTERVAEMLFIDNLEGAYNYLNEWVRKNEIAPSIGAIKVANIMFFKEFKDAWEKSSEGKNLPLFAINFLNAVKNVVERKWIRFYPDVPLAKIVRYSHPLIKEITTVANPISRIFSIKPINDILVAYHSFLAPVRIPYPLH